jgi:hypothetical protein
MRTVRMTAALSFLGILYLPACGGGGSSPPPATYTISGKMAGLTAAGLMLANGSDTVSPAPNATTFTFSMRLTSGTAYDVVIKSQPSVLACQISGGSGTVGSKDVTSISISCPSPWFWKGGSNVPNAPGVYGTQGVAAAGNVPGARQGAVTWTDGAGNFWLFGGVDVSENGNEPTAASGNMPGARTGASTWVDHSGNLLLFGGIGLGQNQDVAPGAYNDLWSYSPSSGQWTWISGADTGSATTVSPTYGTLGVAALGNTPGSSDSAASWIDASGNLWLFGGGLVSGTLITSNSLNDLWEFNRQ